MKFIGIEPESGRLQLASVGVEFHAIGHEGSSLESELVAHTLPESERHIRATFDAKPPEPGEEHAAHCAWHTNGVHEAHTINSGRGIFQIQAGKDCITVIGEAGDLFINRGAEHRYRPLTSQQLRLRHTGATDGEFGYVDTGRSPTPWPDLS